MKITVLIPARNEQETILEILHRVKMEFEYFDGEIIVIDDGSHDATAELVGSVSGVSVIRLPVSRGKGAALQAGLRQARGDIILIQDADLEYDPTDYPILLRSVLKGDAQVVYGSRILGAAAGRSTGLPSLERYWGGRFLSWLTTALYGAKITDINTGYKVFRTACLRNLEFQAEGFEFSAEITAQLLKKGIPILEVPIAYTPRTLVQGKKYCWKDGIRALGMLLKMRWKQPEEQDKTGDCKLEKE
jgi:glycosyltransferase involved in cell wall biosynthesis